MASTILAGTIIGAVSRDKIITGEQIQVGDVLVGLPSNGLHTNGYSLARKLLFDVAKYGPDQYVNELKDKTGAALMRTHRSYLWVIKKLAGAEVVSGMAHITGGGITDNLPRILPKGMGASVDLAAGRFRRCLSTCSSWATWIRTRCCAPSTWASG